MKHPISGEIKELTEAEFFALFDESVHAPIRNGISRYPDAEGVVCFENLQLDSSRCGHRTALIMGPSNSWPLKTCEEERLRLGDLPSRFQYPVAVLRLPLKK